MYFARIHSGSRTMANLRKTHYLEIIKTKRKLEELIITAEVIPQIH